MIEYGQFPPIAEEVYRRIAEDREHYRRGQTLLVPKNATVLDSDPSFGLELIRGQSFTLEGEGFLPSDSLLGGRTVFLEPPVEVEDQKYYLEVKGYGHNGQGLFTHTHPEGDLFFGFYLENARREYEIPQILRAAGIEGIQRSVALFEFSETDFLEYASKTGLKSKIASHVMLGLLPSCPRLKSILAEKYPEYANLPEDFYRDLLQALDDDREADAIVDEVSAEAAGRLVQAYRQGGLKTLMETAKKYQIERAVDGVRDGNQYGYVIRASLSPMRYGYEINEREPVTSKGRAIAKKIGTTVRQMLELGYLAFYPHPGNWTTAGELVDFEDVAHVVKDWSVIEADMKFRQISNFQDYLANTLSTKTLGHLAPDFLAGFMGRPANTHEAACEAQKVIEKIQGN